MNGDEDVDVRGKIILVAPNEVQWTVPDFISLPEEDDYCFRSPCFPYMDGTWCFRCYPNGGSFAGILLCLQREQSVSKHSISFRLGMKTEQGFEISQTLEGDFDSDGEECGEDLHVERSYLVKHKISLEPENVLTFFCSFPSASNKSASIGTEKLLKGLENIFLTGDHHDTTIKIQDQEFRVHKFILVVRSPVFDAMFRHDTTERNTGIIIIEDCNPETFKEFLAFLYSGKVENLSVENVTNLYYVAEKYQVDELKLECMKFMKNNLSIDYICDFISLALKHSERELLKIATNYFVKNAKKIIVTAKWLTFHKEYLVESNELHIKTLNFLIPD